MSVNGLKAITPVPNVNDFLDIILSSVQRKTPTVIHKNFKISRIRNFYMRKVKFTQDLFDMKLGGILSEFPILDNLHPFLSSLLNVLYDKNHYKLALGQLNTARHLIDQVGKDYVRLLKFGDSLYRCKQLKKAALGRMATIMRRQKEPLAYLEQVRQHISRLPAIDPNTRTLIICGYPNVGKSSFINKITRADVDVQPYAFTTKSLFVGHMDYRYLRWQVIDTPGLLDRPLEEFTTIEMQSITALAHLRSAVLYFMDVSEQCGYTVEAQCKLFHSIKPLFNNKPVILVINKIDVLRLDELPAETRVLVDEIINLPEVTCVQTSAYTEEGVVNVRDKACDALLAHRVEQKLRGNRLEAVANKIHVAMPSKRDDVERPAFIPPAALAKKKYDKEDPERIRLERDDEQEMMGQGIFTQDLRKGWLLEDPDWKYDVQPELLDGKNVADFIDPDIMEKLEALEREEEKLEAEGFYQSDDEEIVGSDEEEIRDAAKQIAEKKALLKKLSQSKNTLKNRPVLPRKTQHVSLKQFTTGMKQIGLDPKHLEKRAEKLVAKEKEAYEAFKAQNGGDDQDGMDVDEEAVAGPSTGTSKYTGRSRAIAERRAPRTDRRTGGLTTATQSAKADELERLGRRPAALFGRAGEGDRHVPDMKPKWLYSGKRKNGTNDRR
ncbi:P-loop containing nucleoside triphosphate hydrolase protein [Filobasidium floriforme]|uniref:P-loop containing nucleoside triphosphate hydrolase protein n=1 Tax=Filobasidium floriforme TaxID=5210 RepID=UPI001E8D50B2|nr:P-loop containing nucleoside triphosphate hydrolase protein [Filobasidium floriforme]KAH8089144.1 P-loop containing nucleoside triphosphate hydrolase protein [Filobasidium floriforme]